MAAFCITTGMRLIDILPTAKAGGFLDTDGICLPGASTLPVSTYMIYTFSPS